MDKCDNKARENNNFKKELMKVYGHCFANGCYDDKDKYDHKCDDKYDKYCDNDDDNDKCYDKYHKHDDNKDKCNNKEKEIKNLFKFIFAELDNMECDLEKIEKALKKLFNLLDDDCSCDNKKDDFKCIAEDLKVLNYFINKTKKDLKCLAKKTL